MVTGLDVFRDHFRAFSKHFVLIGGTACEIVMNRAGLDFRATKDLDIVLRHPATLPAPSAPGLRLL